MNTVELKLLAINAELVEALGVMTELCAIKYGNLDKGVYEWIQKSRELRMRALQCACDPGECAYNGACMPAD